MKTFCLFRRVLIAASLLGLTTVFSTTVHADDYGDLSGQFILDGDIPPVEMLENKKEPTCGDPIASDKLKINKDNKGIANIFVYIPATKKPKVHPDLKDSKSKEVVLDQKNCMFMPHALVARTDQTLLIKSMDAFNHNTRTAPIKNQPVNFTVTPNEQKGLPVKLTVAETLPTEVKCDIHPWMTAYCLIIDHPYAVVTDADGKFKIEKLPAGDLEFRYWHSKVGYVEKTVKITIKKGDNNLGQIKVPVKKFTDVK